jgi:hypothetical protein
MERRNVQKLALQGKLWYKVRYSGLLLTSRSTPLGNLDQVIRLPEGIFLKTSARLLRNRRITGDYLARPQTAI